MYIYEVYLNYNVDKQFKRFFNSYDKCEFYARTKMLKEFNIDPNDIIFHRVIDSLWECDLDKVWVTEPWDCKVIVIRKYILGE